MSAKQNVAESPDRSNGTFKSCLKVYAQNYLSLHEVLNSSQKEGDISYNFLYYVIWLVKSSPQVHVLLLVLDLLYQHIEHIPFHYIKHTNFKRQHVCFLRFYVLQNA